MTALLGAQRRPDFTGRWVLIDAGAPNRDPALPIITAARERLVRQSPTSVTVERPPGPGSHPAAGIHTFGSRGMVGRETRVYSDVFWFGDQLVIGTETETPIGAAVEQVNESGEIWSLEDGRLVIECRERMADAVTRATLTYKKR